jgi:hypothetical protein
MSENNQSLVIPAFGKFPSITLDMDKIREAEVRFIEAKTVNPSTYADLEHTFNESYRDLKRHLSTISYQITMAEKSVREAKADVILGSYADHLKDKPAYHNNTDLRDAFLMKDETYVSSLDRVAQLKAIEANFEGKIKVVENVCKYMRQTMYLLAKSGVPMENLTVTSGRK